MAFPVVEHADTQSGGVGSASASWTATYPTNLANGDLILVFVSCNNNPTVSATGFTDIQDTAAAALTLGDGVTNGGRVMGRVSNGTETGNFTITLGAAEEGVWRVIRITGWRNSGTLTPDDVVGSVKVTGNDTAPDPGSLNPPNWDIEDTLWIAISGNDGSTTTTTGWPTNYTDTFSQVPGAGAAGACLGGAYRELAAASDNPSAFTLNVSQQWGAVTIAVRPAAPAADAADFKVVRHSRDGTW